MELSNDILVQIISFILNTKTPRSKNNKLTLGNIRLVCSEWNKVGIMDMFWYPIAKELCPNKPVGNPYLYVKALSNNLFMNQPVTLENWYQKYIMTVEIWDSNTGISYFWCQGPIGIENLSNSTQTRLGILNNYQTTVVKTPFIEDVIRNTNLSSRITLSNKNKTAILSNNINKGKFVSNREVGGYFNLPQNTKFISENKTNYIVNEMTGYLCFDIIPSENELFEVHTNSSGKYVSSVCYLFCNKEISVAKFISEKLNWF